MDKRWEDYSFLEIVPIAGEEKVVVTSVTVTEMNRVAK